MSYSYPNEQIICDDGYSPRKRMIDTMPASLLQNQYNINTQALASYDWHKLTSCRAK